MTKQCCLGNGIPKRLVFDGVPTEALTFGSLPAYAQAGDGRFGIVSTAQLPVALAYCRAPLSMPVRAGKRYQRACHPGEKERVATHTAR
jgi:hypothetical protein